ncbi:MAG TPA: VOC family protein [Puia sp.]|nr:VOC family protein [Puia sp.]
MQKNPKIPDNYQTVMVYLIVHEAEKFIRFTQNVFGASLTHKHMRDERTIMHGEIMIGECTLMFADATEVFLPRVDSMFVYVEDADISYRKAIEEGGAALTPLADQPYGRSGGISDPFGNIWWITSVNKS